MLLNILSVHLFGDKYVLKCNKKIDEIKMGYLFLIQQFSMLIKLFHANEALSSTRWQYQSQV